MTSGRGWYRRAARAVRASNQRELPLEPFALVRQPASAQRADCPPPVRHTQDQYRCTACGLVWDTDEPKPPCEGETP